MLPRNADAHALPLVKSKMRRSLYLFVCINIFFSGTSVVASPLDKLESGYVAAMVGAMAVVTQCPGYKFVDHGPQKVADRMGINFEKFSAAIVAAMAARGGFRYERKDLIPEVTRVVNETHNLIHANLAVEKEKTCRRWGSALPADLVTGQR